MVASTKFHFDIEDKIELFNAPLYQKYLQILGASTSTEIEKDGSIITDTLKVIPPVLVSVETALKEISDQRRQYMRSFHDVYIKIIHDDKNADHFKEQYERLLEKIYALDSLSDKMHTYYDRANQTRKDAISSLRDKYQEIMMEMDEETSVKKRIKLYKRAMKLDDQLQEFKNSDTAVDYYIEALPKFTENNLVKPKQEKPSKATKATKATKTAKTAKGPKPSNSIDLSNEQINEIESNVARLIREKFPFKSKEECVSSKRSTPFYMSKEDITKNIKSDPNIKNLMPKNYSTLSKKEICDHLFFE